MAACAAHQPACGKGMQHTFYMLACTLTNTASKAHLRNKTQALIQVLRQLARMRVR